MTMPERRHIPRTTLEKLAYIDIESNNGGIVLNVSGEGLCFHSIAPVERSGPFRFSLLEHNRRIDACGELVWTDEIQKVGGLRFTTLTSEARGQINDWIAQPLVSLEEDKASTSQFALPSVFRALGARRFDRKANSGSFSPLAVALLKLRVRVKLSGFSGGLATGLLVSALGASIFLFSYTHRREFGESLIRLGKRLAASPEVQRQSALPAPRAVAPTVMLPRKETVSPTRAQLSIGSRVAAERHQKLLVQPLGSAVKPPQVKLTPPTPTIAASQGVGSPGSQHSPVTSAGEIASAPPDVSLGAPSLPAAANLIANKVDTTTHLELASASHTRAFSQQTGSTLQMYFDLGRFKDGLLAHAMSDRVAQLGLRTTVIQKGHLWTNSYQVLVGPYSNEEEETRIQNDLFSHGYRPRPFERGSRDFAFSSRVSLNGARLPVGDFTISWESYVADAKVRFAHGHDVIATADGIWMKRPQKYSQDEYVYVKNGDGSRTLREIHFSGLNRALVFRNRS
jgi:hypothetical protein